MAHTLLLRSTSQDDAREASAIHRLDTLGLDEEIVGQSAALRDVLHQLATVAPTESTVLVYGETGTGKELIARAIHRCSARRRGPLVKLNCAAIPSGLLESELFGHERGAFTGAFARRTGRFELAHNGTLFLDEIGEMSADLQPKLLRLLQEREFERVGGNRTIQSNARLVAATNRDLKSMVDEKAFREDLYYRLSVFPIRVPALRERSEDVPLLARSFAEGLAARMGKEAPRFSESSMARLRAHDWPGNIRELQNVIERAVILGRDPEVEIAPPSSRPSVAPPAPHKALDALADVDRAHILAVLHKTNWVIGGPHGAAVRLGMKRSTLNFRMKKLGITRMARAVASEATDQSA